MHRFAVLLVLPLFIACGKNSDTGDLATGTVPTGGATGSGTGTGTGTGTGGSTTTDVFDVAVVAPNQSCDPAGTTSTLNLTGDSGRVTVNHIGVFGDQCADWEITAVGTQSTMTIDVTYTDNNTSSCGTTQCAFTLSYILNDLDPGTWTVNANSESAQVVVE